MKMYIFTITYNFDGDYIAQKFNTFTAAFLMLEKMLKTEVETVRNECEYEPSVIRFADDDVCLIYEEDVTLENHTEFTKSDTAYYRIFEVEV